MPSGSTQRKVGLQSPFDRLAKVAAHCWPCCRIEPSNTKDLTPFQDVRLGPLVGKGSFGKVYRGIWKDTIVAIKVPNTRPYLNQCCTALRAVLGWGCSADRGYKGGKGEGGNCQTSRPTGRWQSTLEA